MKRAPLSPAADSALYPVVLLVILAAAIRFFRLDHQSLWIDEVLMIQRASLGEPFRWADWLVNPQGPLPALLLRLSTHLMGVSEYAMRFPSAIAGTLTVPATYLLARRLNPDSAWAAGIMAAFSPLLIWYSQENRHYALAVLAAVWSATALLRLVEETTPRVSTQLSLFAGILVGLLSHLSMVFVVAAQGLSLLIWHRDRFRPWLLAVLPAFLIMSPWFFVAVTENLNLKHLAHTGPIPTEEMLRGESTFSWWGIPYTAYVFFAGYSLGPPLGVLHAHPSPVALFPYAPSVAALTIGAGVLLIAGVRSMLRSPFRLGLILLWTMLPLLAVILLSQRNAKVFNPRYILVALPLWLCLAGSGLSSLFRRSVLAGIAVVLLLGGATTQSIVQYFGDGRYARENVRAAATLLTRETREHDIVLAQGVPQVLRWYYDGRAPVQAVQEFDVRSEERLDRKVREWLEGRHRVWLFISRPWLQDPELRLNALMDEMAGPGVEYAYDGVRVILYEMKGAPR